MTGGSVRIARRGLPPIGSLAWRALRRRMQMVYQDPLGALDRRLSVGRQVMEPLAIHGIGAHGRAAQQKALAMMDAVGLARASLRPLPARAVGRPAPAHRAGARADPRSAAPGLRRADLGARRLDPGAGGEPAARPAAAARARLPLHQPRPAHGAAGQPRGGGDVSRPHRRAGRSRPAVRRAGASLHAGAGVGDSRRQARPDAAAWCCRASHPIRSIGRRAVPSIRAAAMRVARCRVETPDAARLWPTAGVRPAISPKNCRRAWPPDAALSRRAPAARHPHHLPGHHLRLLRAACSRAIRR